MYVLNSCSLEELCSPVATETERAKWMLIAVNWLRTQSDSEYLHIAKFFYVCTLGACFAMAFNSLHKSEASISLGSPCCKACSYFKHCFIMCFEVYSTNCELYRGSHTQLILCICVNLSFSLLYCCVKDCKMKVQFEIFSGNLPFLLIQTGSALQIANIS
jgi:hypothetical protein